MFIVGKVVSIGDTKYHNKKSILVKFNYNEVSAYLLEIGDLYLRIWKDGVYTGTELASVFTGKAFT